MCISRMGVRSLLLIVSIGRYGVSFMGVVILIVLRSLQMGAYWM